MMNEGRQRFVRRVSHQPPDRTDRRDSDQDHHGRTYELPRAGLRRTMGDASQVRLRRGGARGIRVELLELRGLLIDQLRIMTQMAAGIDRRAESGEVLGLQRFHDPRVNMQLFGCLQDRQALLLPSRS
jgi:hypothetical protein